MIDLYDILKQASNNEWVSLTPEDVRKFSPDIKKILLCTYDEKIHLIWQRQNNSCWEAFIPYDSSLKKELVKTLNSPKNRGTINIINFNKIQEQSKLCHIFTKPKIESVPLPNTLGNGTDR